MGSLGGKVAVVTGGSRDRAGDRAPARDGGRIINISTLSTALPEAGAGLYCASKAALEQFTAVAARELGPRGITVNAISPGATDTELLRTENPPEAIDAYIGFTALGRLGRPDEIAGVVAFLAGPDASWITGEPCLPGRVSARYGQ